MNERIPDALSEYDVFEREGTGALKCTLVFDVEEDDMPSLELAVELADDFTMHSIDCGLATIRDTVFLRRLAFESGGRHVEALDAFEYRLPEAWALLTTLEEAFGNAGLDKILQWAEWWLVALRSGVE